MEGFLTEWMGSLIKISGILFAGLLMVFLGRYNQRNKIAPWFIQDR